ncbi:MAG: hypothetical protein KAJ48_02985 [Elusimicrobiales bacterium]|nr:hypothetical protein [Elusimicrobiales bacterium]
MKKSHYQIIKEIKNGLSLILMGVELKYNLSVNCRMTNIKIKRLTKQKRKRHTPKKIINDLFKKLKLKSEVL